MSCDIEPFIRLVDAVRPIVVLVLAGWGFLELVKILARRAAPQEPPP